MSFVLNKHELNFITPIDGVFMDEFVEIKMGFDGSLHTEFSKIWLITNIVDSSLYLWTCKFESDHLEIF